MKRTPSTLGRFVFFLTLGLLSNPILPWPTSEAQAESFNAKTGAWEMTYTGLSSGTMIPPEVLAKMPPEQRARIEQSMQARSANPGTHAAKSCITKEDLDQNRIIKEEEEDEPGCTTKVVSKSSSKMVLERACPSPRASTSRMAMEAKTPETLVRASTWTGRDLARCTSTSKAAGSVPAVRALRTELPSDLAVRLRGGWIVV